MVENLEPRVAIIILVWNDYLNTKQCLESLAQIDYKNMEIVIVDNNSSTDCMAKLQAEYKNLTYLLNDENYGYAEGNNIGIRYALDHGAEYVLILNNDVIIKNKDLLSEMISCFEKNAGLGILGPKVMQYAGDVGYRPYQYDYYFYTRIRDRLLRKNFAKIHLANVNNLIIRLWVPGSAIMFSRELLSQVGMFNSEFFMFAEENDLCIRAVKSGFMVCQVASDKTLVYHMAGMSYGHTANWRSCLQTRNEITLLNNFTGTDYGLVLLFFCKKFIKPTLRLLFVGDYTRFLASCTGILYGIMWRLRDKLGLSRKFEYLEEGRAISSGNTRLCRFFY